MTELEKQIQQKKGGSRNMASSASYLSDAIEQKKRGGVMPTLYADAAREAGGANNLYSSVAKAAVNKARQTAAGNVLSGTPYADAAAQMKQGGANNSFWHGVAGLAETAWANVWEGLRTGSNEVGYRVQAAAPLNAADDAYYKAMWEQTTGRKTGVEIPKDTRTQEQRDLDEYMGVGNLYSDAARAMQRATEKEYERLDREGVKTTFKRDGTYQERVDQKYADLGPKWQQAMGIAGSVGNQMIPILGRIAGTAIGGPQAGEAAQSILFFNQASGAAIEEALNDGADWDKALTYGTVIGGIEAATEAAGDAAGKVLFKAAGKALPKEAFTRALIGTLTNSKAMRTTLTILGQMNGEGLEEVASDLVSPFAKSIYNGKTPGQNWMDEVTLQGLWESYLGGAISGGILSGLGGAVNKQFRAQNQLYADATVNTALQEARASARENGLFNSQTKEKIIDAGLEMQNLEANQRTAAAEAQEHMQLVREAQKAMRGDAGARERLLKMIEGNDTAGTQNTAEGVSGARRGTENDNPSVSLTAATSPYTGEAGSQNDVKGEMTNGQSAYQGRENGYADLRTGGEGLRAEGGKGTVVGGQGEIRQGVGEYAQGDLRQVTPAQLGIRNGGNETITLVDTQKLGGEAKSAADFITANGREAVAVRGAIQVGAGYANAYVENGKVYFRVDATDAAGNPISPKKLAQHELFHEYVNDEVLERAADFIRESMTVEEFDAMKESYRTAYASIYDFASMSEAEIEQILREEIAADAYAGMNWFSKDTAVQEAIRAETERNAPAQRAEAQQDSTGPPVGRTAIEVARANGDIQRNVLDYADKSARNAAQKALHDRMVSEGKTLDLTENRESASQYFPDLRSMPKAERTSILREKIRTLKNDLRTYLNQLKGVNFEFEINGNTIEATIYNAGVKEVLQNLTQDKAGMLTASEEIFRNAEYLYSTQDKTGNQNIVGWDYFYAPVKLGDETAGVRIAVRNMVAPAESQIYNWGIKKGDTSLDGVGLTPKGSTSADVSSDVSRDSTIRSSSPNSQEKSSGRASVEVEKLTYAERMEKRKQELAEMKSEYESRKKAYDAKKQQDKSYYDRAEWKWLKNTKRKIEATESGRIDYTISVYDSKKKGYQDTIVTAKNKVTGKERSIRISDSQGMTDIEKKAYGEKLIREMVEQEPIDAAREEAEAAAEAERKEAEAYEAAKEETKDRRIYDPIQSVGEYTEKLVRLESALETADNAAMEEGKNRYEARISEEGGYVYAYVYKNRKLLAKAKGKDRKKVPRWVANQIRIDFGERTVFHPALQERGNYDLDLKKAKKDGYPVLQKKNGERVQAVPFWTWVKSKSRGNYGLVVSKLDNWIGPDGQGTVEVFYYNKKTDKGMIVPENAVSVYAVDGQYSDMYAEEKAAARMNDEAAEAERAAEREKLRKAMEEASPFGARENDTTATTILRTQNTSMGAGTIFQKLISKGWARVKAQVTTTSPKIAEWEIQMDTNGVQYWADISLDGKKVKRIIEMKKNDAAQKAAEYVDEEANKAFTDANVERAARQAAEEQAEHDAKVAELLGEPDPVDIIFPSESKVADEPTAAEKAESRVAENVEKKTTAFLENASELWHGALRMLENAGDTVSRMSKATGNKSLEGYYFNAGAYSQRAGNWIAPGGARTDIDGKKLGKSLEDMLAPMRKDPEVYRLFNLYALHLHNIDRMKYDNTAELETIKKQLDAIENTFPELRNQPGYVEQMAAHDEKTKLTSEHAEIILTEMAEGNPPNVSSLAEAAQLLLYARRKQARIQGQGMKPVFGYDVTAYDSQREVKRLEAEHPEFKEWMKEVKQYSDDLLDYRVQAGLDTRESVEAMKKRYPNYVPTLRVEGTNGKAARRARRSGGITVSDAIGRAVGSDAVLLPLHTALSRKTVAVMRNAGMNMLGREFLKEWSGKNKAKVSDYITNVSEYENSTTDQQYTDDYLYKPVKDNVFSVYDNGKLYEITMDEGLTVAMRAFEPDKFGGYAVAKGMKKLNDLFKALCTGYNPFFTARNAVRDWMDAGFYSTDTKTWEKMYWSAWNQICTTGEIWQQYKALGGSYASLLDYTTGMTKQPKNAAGRVVAKFEAISQAVEAAPRLAEFMTILANKGGSKTVDGVKTGEFTTSDYMEAMLGAADITTNFARGGTVAKALNRYVVPFLNPSIQGFSKFVRNAIETKSVKAAGSLILKAALAGILPTLLGELMYGDDEEWADIPPASKANYYLIKLGNGYWLKIPQGRAVAVLSTVGVYGMEKIKGNEVTFSDVFDVVKSNIAPTDIFNQNLATAFTQTKLLNPDNPGTTWYGGNIENERMQNLRPEDRYDENTDALSKLLGKTFHLSPKKINYLLDQYTGVIGDLLLPMLKPAAKAPVKILEPVYSAFTIDTTNTNVTTGQYYDLLDELKYDANDGDAAADVTRRYANHAGAEISDYYSQIREIQNDKNLNAQEKNELVRALKKQLIEREKEIISDAERYRDAVESYMSANPELATDNAAAVAEFAEKYEITEDQAEDRMDAIVYREANREVFGAEYALRTYNSDVYDKARAAYAKGVSYDTYYDYYFATKDMHADKDENGKSISGSKKAKVVEYINSLDIPPEQKDALYIAAGYTEKSAKYQKWNGGSGSSGGGRGGKTAKFKAPAAPKAAKITIPGTAGDGTAQGRTASAPRTSVKVADIAKAADVGKLREAAKKTTRTAIKAGNRTIYIEDGSPLDYFLKTGKLPSTK